MDLLSSGQASEESLKVRLSLARQDLSRRLTFHHRSSEATLICQKACFRDGVMAGAYRGISLYLLNCLVARLIISKTAVLGLKT